MHHIKQSAIDMQTPRIWNWVRKYLKSILFRKFKINVCNQGTFIGNISAAKTYGIANKPNELKNTMHAKQSNGIQLYSG